MKRILAVLFAAACLWFPGCESEEYRDQLEPLIAEHNDIRTTNGLNALAVDERLNVAAQKHANYMASRDKLSHYGRLNSRPSTRVTAEGYQYYLVAENIAGRYKNLDRLMKEWMISPGHRKNILGKFKHIGAGAAKSKNGDIYWCVLFAVPKDIK